jgi:hypothetical protein
MVLDVVAILLSFVSRIFNFGEINDKHPGSIGCQCTRFMIALTSGYTTTGMQDGSEM